MNISSYGRELRDIDELMNIIEREANERGVPVNLFLFIDINPIRLGIPRRQYDMMRKMEIIGRNGGVDLEEFK